VDATNLSRSLFFTTQLLELDVPVVVALNKADINEKKETVIDTIALSQKLGCPVIDTVSTSAEGLAEVVKCAMAQVDTKQIAPYVQDDIDLTDKKAVVEADRKRFEFVNAIVKEVESRKILTKDKNFGDKIDAETVKNSGLYDAFMRARKYSSGFKKNVHSPVIRAIIVEILHILKNINSYSEADKTDGPLKDIIRYLNENFTQNITLNELEEKFYISKYQLCHIFPKATGITLHQYITNKRMAFAQDMISIGKPVGEAATMAGFNNYSSFYRAYIQKYGKPPKKHSN
jgi:AraC-like DNA-binding protein